MCKHTSVKFKLQQLTNETIPLSAFTGNEAQLDICAKVFGKQVRWHFLM